MAEPGTVVGIVVPDSEDAQYLVDVQGFRPPAPAGWLSAAGEDLAGMDPTAGRSQVFAGEHEAALFAGTVGENLAGTEAVPDGRALAASAVVDVLGHLDSGLETLRNNQGKQLSGGQRQRLVLGIMSCWQAWQATGNWWNHEHAGQPSPDRHCGADAGRDVAAAIQAAGAPHGDHSGAAVVSQLWPPGAGHPWLYGQHRGGRPPGPALLPRI